MYKKRKEYCVYASQVIGFNIITDIDRCTVITEDKGLTCTCQYDKLLNLPYIRDVDKDNSKLYIHIGDWLVRGVHDYIYLYTDLDFKLVFEEL